MRHRLIAALIATSTLALASPTLLTVSAASTKHQSVASTLTWRQCHARFECARIEVPLDYQHQRGRLIELALIKLPATEAADPRTLFINPGGPGDSGVRFVLNHGRSAFDTSVRKRFDIIGMDPRGVGRSTPLQCFQSFKDELRVFGRVPSFPITRREENMTANANEKLADACANRRPSLASHLTTGEVAKDLNLLRRAVGDRRLTFVGYSYGSYLASVYANMFPDRVRAVVADGVIDPVSWLGAGEKGHKVPVDVRLMSDQGAEAVLNSFLRACNQDPGRCAFSDGGPKRAKAKYEKLMRRNQHHAIRLPGNGSYSYTETVSTIRWQFYDSWRWGKIAIFLQRLWRHSADVPSQSIIAEDSIPPAVVEEPSRARVGGYFNVYDVGAAVTCGDTHNPRAAAAWRMWADLRARAAPTFGRWWAWLDEVCGPWSLPAPGRYEGPFNRVTHHPLLVVGNLHDPATRYQDAVDTAARQPGAHLLTIAGSGHTSLGVQSPCANRVITRYLLHPNDVPSRDTCPTVGKPFS